jgi:hypothetical protein
VDGSLSLGEPWCVVPDQATEDQRLIAQTGNEHEQDRLVEFRASAPGLVEIGGVGVEEAERRTISATLARPRGPRYLSPRIAAIRMLSLHLPINLFCKSSAGRSSWAHPCGERRLKIEDRWRRLCWRICSSMTSAIPAGIVAFVLLCIPLSNYGGYLSDQV